MRSLLRFLLKPVFWPILKYFRVDDPWERFAFDAPLYVYGGGSYRDFSWYFEGDSAVRVSNLDEIQDWLLQCEYADDKHLFQDSDFWQHPRTFEHLRRGDCEDHALWAWRKLVELGIDAELVAGQQLSESGISDKDSGHAWVLIRRERETLLFETSSKRKDRMLKPLNAAIRAEYRPEVGVDASRKRFAYFGYLLTLKEREAALGRSKR